MLLHRLGRRCQLLRLDRHVPMMLMLIFDGWDGANDECIGSDESTSRKIHVLLEKELYT